MQKSTNSHVSGVLAHSGLCNLVAGTASLSLGGNSPEELTSSGAMLVAEQFLGNFYAKSAQAAIEVNSWGGC